jgi:hypothetical protein
MTKQKNKANQFKVYRQVCKVLLYRLRLPKALTTCYSRFRSSCFSSSLQTEPACIPSFPRAHSCAVGNNSTCGTEILPNDALGSNARKPSQLDRKYHTPTGSHARAEPVLRDELPLLCELSRPDQRVMDIAGLCGVLCRRTMAARGR